MLKLLTHKILLFLAFTTTYITFGLGTWLKEVTPLDPFKPDYVLLKTAVFSAHGSLKVVKDPLQLRSACHSVPVIAWVTHRLSKNETLSEAAGKRLGSELNALLKETCVKRVELDVEPLPEAFDWFVKFTVAVKASLGDLSLSVAVPAEFSKSSFVKLLAITDGLDLMAYDTGFKESPEYVRYLREKLSLFDELSVQFPGTKSFLGLPAYYDKTKLHSAKSENLKSVLLALSSFKPQNTKVWCEKRMDFAIYAGWVMTSEDKALTQLVRAWRESLCKKG